MSAAAKVTDVRLADGETEHEGRVEIFYRDEWGTMCDSSVTLHEGHIICRELGYLGAVEIYRHGTSTGPVDGPIAWNFNCEGIESELQWTDCYIREWNTSECSHVEDAGLRCNNMRECKHFRLQCNNSKSVTEIVRHDSNSPCGQNTQNVSDERCMHQ